jgi:hypothetical protein
MRKSLRVVLMLCLSTAPIAAQTPPDSAVAMRYALQLGQSYANAARVHGRPSTSSEHAEAREAMRRSIERRSRRLGIVPITQFGIEPTTDANLRYERIVQFTQRTNSIALELHTRYGRRVAAAFRLGYVAFAGLDVVDEAGLPQYLGAFGETLTALSLTTHAGPFLAQRYPRSDSTPAQDRTFAWIRALQREMDDKYSSPTTRARSALAIWTMGEKLSLAALGASRGAERRITDRLFQEASTIADALSVQLPALPTEQGEPATRTAIALYYVMNDVGENTVDIVRDEYGARSAALFEMAIKYPIVLMMYGAESSMHEVVERTARDAGLPDHLWLPVVQSMRRGESSSVVSSMLQSMSREIKAYLENMS